MQIIKVRKGKIDHRIMVDDQDFEWLSKLRWVWRNGYACTRIFGNYIGMHRLIMDAHRGEDIIIDHIDNNHKNNQRFNLRRANRFQNQQNRRTNRKNTLPKGIRLLPSGKYNVRLQTNNQRVIVGTFPTLEEAVEERNRVAKQLHKEFFNPSYILD